MQTKGFFRHISGKSLLAGVSLATLCVPGVAMAQDADEGDDQPAIVVTGSRVSTGDAPVGATATVLGREEIAASAATTVDQLVKELPQVFNLGVTDSSRSQSGGAGNIVYGNAVNLRGIGPYATLVLVDGHRVVSNGRSVDPSGLPTLGLERVEVVANGASAIYGSDAIAGVVNLIPRRSLDGIEASARYNISDDGAFDQWTAGIAAGVVFDRGQVMIAYEHVDRSNLNGLDRDFYTNDLTPFGGNDYRVTACDPGTAIIDGVSYALPAIYQQSNAGSLVPNTANLCDSQIGQDLFPSQTYDNVNATATFEFTDNFEFFADGFYSRREFVRQRPGVATTLTVPETNAFFVRPPGFTGTSYNIEYNFAGDPRGQQPGTGYYEIWQVSPGLRLRLPFDWEVEAQLSYGETDEMSRDIGNLSRGGLAAALASSDPATAFDPYGLYRTSDATMDSIFGDVFITDTAGQLTVYEAGANGPLFALPGGDVMVAVGYERQEFELDLGSIRGPATGARRGFVYDRSVDSFYGEILLPVIDGLDVTAAIRHDKYSDVGNTTNPQFGVDWEVTDFLTLRGTYGTAFRAPGFTEIYGNTGRLTNYGQLYQDPAGGAPIYGVTLSGPNLQLSPEESTTWTAGVDIEPTDSLTISLTYFDIEYTNQVNALLSNLTILSDAALYDGTGIILRGQAARDRIAELVAQGVNSTPLFRPYPGGSLDNVDLFVDGRQLNLGSSQMKGIDFNVTWWTDLGPNDTLRLALNGTYLTDYKTAVVQGAPLIDQLNTIFDPLEFRARFIANWDHGPFSTRVLVTHVGGYTNDAIATPEQVDSYTPVDLTVTWRVAESVPSLPMEGLELTLEAINLFDTDPPFVNLAPSANGFGGYDGSAASPIGRQFAVGARVRF